MLSIPEIASKVVDENVGKKCDNARTIFFAGSKYSGKSSLIYSFLEKIDAPRETLVLEYSFGRKSTQKQSVEKTVCHVWEYGGKLELLKNVLASVPEKGPFYFSIMLDLSKIKTLWSTLEKCLEAIEGTLANSDQKTELLIIGGKYDVFKNYDSEIKKLVCSTIRSVGVLYNAHILFYSSKEPHLVRKGKELLHYVGFGSGSIDKDKNTNFTKPLLIPQGTDTWEGIGVKSSTLDQVKMRYVSRIGQAPVTETSDDNELVTSLKSAHPETTLDAIIALKYQELRDMDSLEPNIYEYLNTLHIK